MTDEIPPGYTRVSELAEMPYILDRIRKKLPLLTEEELKPFGEKGERIHTAIELHAVGIPSEESLPIEERGYFRSYLKWEEANKDDEMICYEKRFNCPELKISGKPDRLRLLKTTRKLRISDWKSSSQEGKKSWPIQGNLYHYLLTPMFGKENLDDVVEFVKLDKKGKMPQIFEYPVDEETWEVCMAAHKLDRWIKK